MIDESPGRARGRDVAAVTFAVFFPSLITWIYFVTLAHSVASTQQSAYSVGKFIQFSFPVFWVFLVQKSRPRWKGAEKKDLALALGFGLFVGAGMLMLYHFVLAPSEWLVRPESEVRAKVSGIGIHHLWEYFALAIFYSLFHSLLEEYYFRWFVFGQLRNLLPVVPAIVISSLAFMAHHVIVLGTYFGWISFATLFFSLCIAVGGAVWAWMYEKSGSLLGPWLSHLLVDAAIFLVGYSMIRSLFVPAAS